MGHPVVVNDVCSLGLLCHTANYLRLAGRRACSYPFDWVFSDFCMLRDCVEDDFAVFLDRGRYVALPGRPDVCGHAAYHPCMFNHKNPLSSDADYAYYGRCVQRFRDLLARETPKLFLVSTFEGEVPVRAVAELKRAIDGRTRNAHLLVLHCSPLVPGDTVTRLPDDVIVAHLCTGATAGCDFHGHRAEESRAKYGALVDRYFRVSSDFPDVAQDRSDGVWPPERDSRSLSRPVTAFNVDDHV